MKKSSPFPFILLGVVGFCLPLAPLACTASEEIINIEFPNEGGGGGGGTGGAGEGGAGGAGGGVDAGPPCSGQCAPLTPFAWSDPILLWVGLVSAKPSACPAEAPTIYYEGFADIVAPNICPLCTCGDPACELPAGLVTSDSNQCQGPTLTPFDAPAGWDGSCASPAPVPSTLLASIEIQPPTVSACKPGMVQPPAAMPSSYWQTAALACRGEAYGECPDSGKKCVPKTGPDAPDFAVCVAYLKEGDAACPTGYDDKRTYYTNLVDQRVCSPCGCEPPVGSNCAAAVAAYQDATCQGVPLMSQLVTLATVDACASGVMPGADLQGMSAQWVANVPGNCTPTGGEPSGEVTPLEPTIFCCIAPLL